MTLLNDLNILEGHVGAMLRQVPGATRLLLFGSRVMVRDDPYADLDLHLVTADMAATQAVWPQVLELLGPLDLCWPMPYAESTVGFMVALRMASLYHKLDLGVGPGPHVPAPIDPQSVRVLWEQPPAPTLPMLPPGSAYIPAVGSYGHLLFEELISAVRYLKARKRGNMLTAWRFVRSKPDVVLRLLAARRSGTLPRGSLSTWAIKALDGMLSDATRVAFLQPLDFRSPAALDAACLDLTNQIVELATDLANQTGEHIPAALVARFVQFVEQELG